ncbi:hypothetical protein DDE74_14580 [Streptomyces lydicus]|uniref:Uncharacterized protein n=1 Tax=Streptomyces lydicus TaxID=47763 RepID=A0A3Q9K998_9ACTN|nr:hypothetical protein DDE74_14580 [Streptomyces lydicus]
MNLLGHARAMLDDRRVSNCELRFLAERMTEALRDALRIAESRGAGAARVAEDRVIARVSGTVADLGWGRRPYVRRAGPFARSTARAGGGRRPWSSRTAGVRQWQSASRSSHGSPTWTAS